MAGVKKTTWIGGAVFAAVLIIVAAWFLAIAPAQATAADTRAEAESTRQSNDLLELQVVKLKADFAKLPQYKADLATIQTQIPTSAQISDYLRQIDQIAVAHAVTVTAISPAAPVAVILAAPEAAAPAAPADGSTPPATDPAATAPAATAPAAPAGTGAPANFTAIPVTLTVVGTYDNAVAFLSDLQNATPRLFLVTGLTATGLHEGSASGGRPATHDGDLELTVTGVTYVLPDPLAPPVAVDPNATPPALPGAVPGKNPVVPIQGH